VKHALPYPAPGHILITVYRSERECSRVVEAKGKVDRRFEPLWDLVSSFARSVGGEAVMHPSLAHPEVEKGRPSKSMGVTDGGDLHPPPF